MDNIRQEWNNKSYADLVNHIVENYHTNLQKDVMPYLSKATTTILRVHGQSHNELAKVHRIFHMIQINMVQHIIRQEVNIFPLIKTYSRKPSEKLLKDILEKIDSFNEVDDDTIDLLVKLREATDNYTTPRDGCATYERTYEMLKELDDNIIEHLQFEDKVLFQRLKEEINNY